MKWFVVGCVSFSAACGRIAFDERTPPGDGARLTYRDAVLADSPLGYLRLGDTGTIARDETGSFDGTYNGGCTSIAGALANDPDRAVSFDGTCNIQLPDALDFVGNAPFSVEVWISEHRLTGFQSFFMNESRAGSSPMDGYGLLESPTGIYLERTVNQVAIATGKISNTIGAEHHIVGTYDGANLRLFVDGMGGPTTQSTAVMPSVVAPAMIGAQSDLMGHLDGDLDEVAVYDHVLPPERIATHYDIGTHGPR